MNWKTESKYLFWIVAIFIGCFYLPVGTERFDQAILEGFHLVKSYAREHVLLCLVPAFFIAGAIGVFVSQASVTKYLGAGANKILAYGVASVSGTILAVCSCTILPLFAGIYKMGAGLGPATAFLYSGPAINALAIILTARILGPQLGIARAVGAVIFSVVIGMLMAFIFSRPASSHLHGRLYQFIHYNQYRPGRKQRVVLVILDLCQTDSAIVAVRSFDCRSASIVRSV